MVRLRHRDDRDRSPVIIFNNDGSRRRVAVAHGCIATVWRAGHIIERSDTLRLCPCRGSGKQQIWRHHSRDFGSKVTITITIAKPSIAAMTLDPVEVQQDIGDLNGRGWESAGRHTEDEVQRPEPKTADSKQDEAKSLAAKACPNKYKAGTPPTLCRKLEDQLDYLEAGRQASRTTKLECQLMCVDA